MMDSEIEFKEYLADLKAPWKTMSADLETALTIINTQSQPNSDPAKLVFASVSVEPKKTEFLFPAWHSEVERVFINQYGLDDGKRIFKKTVMRLYQMSKGTAQPLH